MENILNPTEELIIENEFLIDLQLFANDNFDDDDDYDDDDDDDYDDEDEDDDDDYDDEDEDDDDDYDDEDEDDDDDYDDEDEDDDDDYDDEDEDDDDDYDDEDEDDDDDYDDDEDEDDDDYDDEDELGSLDPDDDVFQSRADYGDIDDEWFEEDNGDWSEEDYEGFAEQIFGDNEYFGDNLDTLMEEQGFNLATEGEAYKEELNAEVSGGFDTINFYEKDNSILPQGFLTSAALATLAAKFPDIVTNALHIIDPPDKRSEKPQVEELPEDLKNVEPKDIVDLRKYCSPIGDQGQTSRCKAFATTHAWEMLNIMQKKEHVELACSYTMYQFQKVQGDAEDFAFAYESAGTISGPEPAKAITKTGICNSALWQNDEEEPNTSLEEMDADAQTRKLKVKPTAIALEDVKKVISSGFPVEVGMNTGEAFMRIGRDGVYRASEAPSGQHGGHSMLIVGYKGNYFIVKNSWGEDWGDKGYCYIPKNVLSQSEPDFTAFLPDRF